MIVAVGVVVPALAPHITTGGGLSPGPQTVTTAAGGPIPVPQTGRDALGAETAFHLFSYILCCICQTIIHGPSLENLFSCCITLVFIIIMHEPQATLASFQDSFWRWLI